MSDANKGWAEELDPGVERAANALSEWINSNPSWNRTIGRIPPELAYLLGKAGPYAVTFAADRMGLKEKLGATGGPMIQSFLGKLATRVGDGLKDPVPAGKTPEQAIQDIVDELSMLKVDNDDYLHFADCIRCQRKEAQQPRSGGGKGKPPAKATPFPTVSIDSAITQGLVPAPCCDTRIREELKKPPKEKKAEPQKSFRGCSAFEILGKVDTRKRRKFMKLLEQVPLDQQVRFYKALQELDSEAEFDGLLDFMKNTSPESWLNALPMLEELNKFNGVKESLGKIGRYLVDCNAKMKASMKGAWEATKEWDEHNFRELAEEAKRKFHEQEATDDMIESAEPVGSIWSRMWSATKEFLSAMNFLR